MTEREIPLAGGNVNAGVVRVGATVRRATTTASPSIHALLLHLEQKGFSASPRFLGIDERGREKLSFFEGETGIPPYIWQGDAPLVAAAKMLRAYHEAALDFVAPSSAHWAFKYPDTRRHEVICHNDFAPYNFVYKDQVPYAVIDFDLVGPGPRLRDIAYAAYWMTPLSFNGDEMKVPAEADLQAGSRRLRLFCETYGVPVDGALFDMLAEQLRFMGDEGEMQQVLGAESAAKLKREGHLAHWQREAEIFLANRPRLARAISRQ
jgi:hypothetical protein